MPNQTTQVKLVAEISASSNGLISALKQASGAINDTTSNWQGKFSQLKDSTGLISQSVKNLGDLVGKLGSSEDLSHFSSSLSEVQSVFSQVQGEVAAFAQQMSALKNSASSLGMPVDEYQQFAEAVKAAGMSIEEGENMIHAMQERIRDFANGVPEAVSQFEKFGISLEKVSSQSATSNFAEIAQAINTTIPPTERATQCMDLFKASVDRTNAVSDQFNKVISRQDKDFVSDKDVQGAIALSSAISKLGIQIGDLVSKQASAVQANDALGSSYLNLFHIVDAKRDELTDLYTTYANYVETLKRQVTSTLDSSKALDVFAKRVKSVSQEIHDAFEEARKESEEASAEEGTVVQIIPDSEIQRLQKTADFVGTLRKKIEEEMVSVSGIMNQRFDAGAPVDMTEIDAATKHVETLKNAVVELYDTMMNAKDSGFIMDGDEAFDAALDDVIALESVLDAAGVSLKHFADTGNSMNASLSFAEAEQTLADYHRELNELTYDMRKGKRVEIDLSKLDEMLAKLDEVKKRGGADEKELNRLVASMTKLRGEVAAHNAEVAKGYPIWQPVVNATRKVSEAVRGIGTALRHPIRSMRSLGQHTKNAASYMTHFKHSSAQASGELKNVPAFLTKSMMQILGMGSAVAVVAKAWQNVNALLKEHIKGLHEAAKAEYYGNAGQAADDMTRVREKRDAEMDKMMSKLKEFADLYDAEQSSRSEEAKAKRANAQEELRKLYGFEFKETAGAIEDLDKQIGEQLDKLRKQRLKAIDSQIKANDKVREGAGEFIDTFTGFTGYWRKLMYTYAEGDLNGANAIKEAQERSTKASDENLALMERRRQVERTDYRGEWQSVRSGKMSDEAGKAQGELLKSLHEARKNLDEWANSFKDTEHQKKLRAIMDRYDDAVEKGALSEDARRVAVEAIAKMLKEEREAEAKKHDELLQAMESRVKAFKDSAKAYVDAQKAISDAQRDYARTQRELADENRAERIAKRRERLAKRMSRFGFSPFEGFSLGESSSERRERRRNAQIDASIADKMGKAEAGGRVHWSPAEKERLKEFQALQKRDKQLEATQKQMEAADKQRKAAEQLDAAAKAIKDAIKGAGDANVALGKAVGEMLSNSLPKRAKRVSKGEAEGVFDNANMTLKGMDANMGQQVSYGSQLDIIHKDLQDLNKRIFVVK